MTSDESDANQWRKRFEHPISRLKAGTQGWTISSEVCAIEPIENQKEQAVLSPTSPLGIYVLKGLQNSSVSTKLFAKRT